MKVNFEYEIKFKYSHCKKTEFKLEIYILVVSKNINICDNVSFVHVEVKQIKFL